MLNVLINNLNKQFKTSNTELINMLNALINNWNKQIEQWTNYYAQCFN